MVLPSANVWSRVTVTVAVIGAPVTTLSPIPTSSWKKTPPPCGPCRDSIMPGPGGGGGAGSFWAKARLDSAIANAVIANNFHVPRRLLLKFIIDSVPFPLKWLADLLLADIPWACFHPPIHNPGLNSRTGLLEQFRHSRPPRRPLAAALPARPPVMPAIPCAPPASRWRSSRDRRTSAPCSRRRCQLAARRLSGRRQTKPR